jgi:hypothetical protein
VPFNKLAPRLALGVLAASVTACASVIGAPTRDQFMRMPSEVRSGGAELVLAPVETGVSHDEVMAAVQRLVADAPACMSWPSLWLDASDRRNVYVARYDLMTRDWGSEVAAASIARMQEFVDLGFLTARPRPELGAGAVEYTLTESGDGVLRGSPYGGERPSFCGPLERRVVEISAMEFGRYPCGNLFVRFTHIADGWPSWAHTPAARARVEQSAAAIGVVAAGTVSLSRQWFRHSATPSGVTNGDLQSVCLNDRGQAGGDDLNLAAP